jgi:nitroreductase
MPPANLDRYEALLTFLRERRSIRRFSAEPLPAGTVERLIEAARWAPSASNRQPFRFLAVETAETRSRMAALVREALKQGIANLPPEAQSAAEAYAEDFVRFESAPLVFVAYHRGENPLAERLGLSGERDVGALSSVSAAIMNLLLAAHALGLGACWMTGALLAGSALESLLGIPAGWRLSALIPVGIPAESPTAPARRTVAQLLARIGGPK